MVPPPARPRDKSGTSTAKEYAASNSTSVQFLGGFQKPWMTGQKGILAHPSQAKPVLQPGQDSSGLRERSGNQQHRRISITRPGQGTSGSGPCHLPSHSQSLRFQDTPSRGFDNPLQTDPNDTSVTVETVLPSPPPSEGYRPEGFQNVESEVGGQVQGGQGGQMQRLPSASPMRHGAVNDWNNNVPNTESITSPPSLDTALPQCPRGSMETPSNTGPQTLSQGASLGKRKRLAPTLAPQTAAAMPCNTMPNSGSHVDPVPSDLQMRSFIGAILARRQTIVDQGDKRTCTEIGHLNLLQQACTKGDHQYLLMHQICCMSSKFSTPAQQLNVGVGQEHLQGLGMLSSFLLGHPPHLTDQAIDWFAQFPLPFKKLFDGFQIYREAIERIQACLAKFAQHWGPFRSYCIKRRSPPFTCELIYSIGAECPTLQYLVFRNIHRHIWVGEKGDACFLEAERLFYQNQQQQPISFSEAERQAEIRDLINSYQRIEATHITHLQSTASHNWTNSIPLQNQPMPPPLRVDQRRTPSNINTQLAQHIFAGPMAMAPPIVPSQQFIQGQNGPLALQDLSRAFPPSPISASPSVSPQGFQTGTFGTGRSPTSIVSSGYAPHQHGHVPSDLRWPTGPWSPAQSHTSQIHQVRSMQPNWGSSVSQPQTPTMMAHPGPAIDPRRFVPQSAPRANALVGPRSEQPGLPSNGRSLPAAAPANPAVTALHQYHVRSPILTARDGSDLLKSGTKYFRYIESSIVSRDRLKIGSRQNVEWRFDVDEARLKSLAGTFRPQSWSLPTRPVEVGSTFCQVRCVDATRFAGSINESDWVVARHVWPRHVTVFLNGKSIDIRKKNHYGRDLPVDITALIREGTNSLLVSVIPGPEEDKAEYAIGMETIRLLDTASAKALTGAIPYEEARQRILQRLQNSDPEIEVIDASITLSMTDPHSSRIWDVPMRSKTCLHDQCFDLDTFLQTRSSNRPGQPCDPERFKCPICDADARPQVLVKDGFFAALRECLAKWNRLDVKAIIMQQDGSWRIKEEEQKTGETGDGTSKRSMVSEHDVVDTRAHGVDLRRESETIEIDDD
ncbi:MAG: hypothetical protein L6R39_003516 [Caloplaca ligustica]|nr:MAG: hypothetical protein L6R39_003516 [Caloplaca ligustica]